MNPNAQRPSLWLPLGLSGLIGIGWFALPFPWLWCPLWVLPFAIYYAMRNPYPLCLMFIIFSFFRIHEAFPVLMPLRIPQLLALGCLGVLSWHLMISNQIKLYWQRELTLFALFFSLVTLGVLMASNRGEAMAAFTGSYSKIAIMVLAISWLTREPHHFALAQRSIIIAGAVIACVAIYNKVNGIGLVEGTRVTISRDIGAMIGDPNDLALVLLFPASFAFSMLTTQGLARWERVLGLLSFLLIIQAIVATQSRGGLLGLTAVMGTVSYFKVKSKLLLFSMGGLVLMVLLAMAGISDRSSGGAGEEGIDESAMGRIYAWGAAWKMALTHPVFGVGLNNFFVNYYFYSDHWDGKNHAVHSTWFGILAETGFVGLLTFICLVSYLVRRALFNLKYVYSTPNISPAIQAAAMSLLAGLFSFMISGTFLTMGFVWPIYIITALLTALGRYIQTLGSASP